MALTHSRREEIAREKGYRSYREYRKASEAERVAATTALAASSGAYKGRATEVERAARQPGNKGRRLVVRTPEGPAVIATRHRGTVLANLDRAGQRHVRANVTTKSGRFVELWKRGGFRASRLATAIRDHGGDVGATIAAFIAELYAGQEWADELDSGGIASMQFVIGAI